MFFQGIVSSSPFSIPLKTQTPPNRFRATLSSSSSPPPSVQFSIPDSELANRGFNLHRSFTSLNIDDLNTVFVRVGFHRRDPAKILTALQHTPTLLWIEHAKTQKPVAFARATGDSVFNAVIWDVVVDPSYQGFGLGKAVMERLVDQLLQTGITNIALYAEPRVVGFYRALGFAADPDGIRGMVYSRKQQKKRR
ncbi:hypothetical protein ACLOJK_031118 [Asimina triloba]